MGILDDIRSELTGPTGPVTETAVPTAMPPAKRGTAMELVAQGLMASNARAADEAYAERVNSLITSDPRGPITLPTGGQMMPRPNVPISVTPQKPPFPGAVGQNPNELDVFQRNEVERQLADRDKFAMGPQTPQKPLTDAEIDKMHPKPALGYGAAAPLDALAATADQLVQSFDPKANPMLGAIVDQFRNEGPDAIIRSIPEVATSLPLGFAGFLGGTAQWVSSSFRRIVSGENVGDAIMNGEADGMEAAAKIASLGGLAPEPGPLAQGVNAAVAAPFSAIMESADSVVGNFTDDPKIKAISRLAVTLALLGGGEKAVKYFKQVAGGRAVLDAGALESMAREGARDPQISLLAQGIKNELDPIVKAERAMNDLASKMDNQFLQEQHHMMRSQAASGTLSKADQARADQFRGVLGRELTRRNIEPISIPFLDELAKHGDRGLEESFGLQGGGKPFVFNNGAVMKMDEKGRQISNAVAPMGEAALDATAHANRTPATAYPGAPESMVVSTSKNGAGAIVNRPLSAKDRVDNLMKLVPFLKPQTDRGYVRVLAPDHPLADEYGRVALHRLIWEKGNDRLTAPWEEVHHKNGIRTDNRLENLELQPTKEAHQAVHAGRTPTDLESSFPLDFDRNPEARPMSGSERIAQIKLLDDLTKSVGLGEKFDDVIIPDRIKRGRKPEPKPAPVEAAPKAPLPPQEQLRGKRSTSYIQAVSKYHVEPAVKSTSENGGSTFNPTRGDMAGSDTFAVGVVPEVQVKIPGKDVDPAVLEKFWKDNAEILASDPDHLGVGTWFNVKDAKHPDGDNMTYIDITATIPKDQNGRAAADYLGRKYDQIAATHLDPEYNFPSWNTGGTGGKNIDPNWLRPADRMTKDPELQRIMSEKPPVEGEPGAGGPPVSEEPGTAPPMATPPAAGEALGKADDPVVQLLDAIQSPGLTVRPEGQARSFRERSEGWVTDWLDRFYPIHKWTKEAVKRGGKMLQGMNPSLMIKAGWLSGVTGRAEALIFKGGFKTDIHGMNRDTGAMPLKEIYKPFAGDMAGFDKYLTFRAAIEEEGLNKWRKPEDWVNTGIDLVEAQAYVSANAAKYESGAKQYTQYFHDRLSELREADLIDPEYEQDLRSKRPNYAPLRRDIDKLAGDLEASGSKGLRSTLDRVASPLRSRLGSDLPVLPPTQSAIIMTYEIENAVLRQQVARATVDLRNRGLEDVITQIFPGPGGEMPTGPDIVMVRNAGKAEYFKVPQDLADSMKMIHEAGLGEWVKRLSIPSRWLRTGATSAPGFAVRNPIRDWQNAFINAKAGFNPITDFTKGLFHLIMKDDSYWKWKQSGAEWSMLVTLDKDMAAEAMREMKAETDSGLEAFKAKWIKSPLAYLEKLSELGEKPTRMGVFEKARSKGMSDMEAAAESRGASTDFATRGAKAKAIASLYTFLNARAQTTYKLAQTAKEHPGKFIVKGLAAAAVPTILLYALNRDDPEYWKRSKEERAMFWFLPMEIGGRQVKVPKGEIGILFGNAVELALEAMDSTPEGRMKVSEYLDSVFKATSPVGNVGETIPTFARPIAEWVDNKKYYSGTPIETESDQGVAPYLRYGPYTSEAAKAVGQASGAFNAGKGVSPKKLENAMYGLTGGVGRMTVGLVDWLAGLAGILPENAKPKEPMSGTPLRPVVQGLLSQRAVGFESEPARMFYAASETVEMTKKTLENLVKQGPGAREGEIESWIKQHPREMELLKLSQTKDASGNPSNLFLKGRDELATLRKAEQKIGADQTMSATDKRKALDLIDKKVSAIVDPVWRLLNAVSQKGSIGPGK